GGCNIICFTTGRGSVFGCKPVPSVKLATNSLMYRHMVDDMDINCGVVLEGAPIATVGRQIFEEVIAVASGKRSKSELSGVGAVARGVAGVGASAGWGAPAPGPRGPKARPRRRGADEGGADPAGAAPARRTRYDGERQRGRGLEYRRRERRVGRQGRQKPG